MHMHTEVSYSIRWADPSPHGEHVVWDDWCLEVLTGECQESGALVSPRKMAPPFYSLVSC